MEELRDSTITPRTIPRAITPRTRVTPPTFIPRTRVTPRTRVIHPTVTPRTRVTPPTVIPRTRVIAPTITTRTDEYEQYNINMLPNELQYEILNKLSLEELRKVFLAIEDPYVRSYARRLGEKLIIWEKLSKLADFEGVKWLHDQDVDILDPEVILEAEVSDNLEPLQWLHAQGADILVPEVISEAAGSGNLELVQWLRDQGA